MNLKQHNNIVQKLIQQIQIKDKQITLLNKQLTQQSKTINNNNNQSNKTTFQSTSVQTQKLIQKRIAQLNKQHQAKLSTLNQQIKTLTQQNQQLKQRLSLKTQLQTKQKQRVAQILKKNVGDRKPGTKQDFKISALVGHYQTQISKKNTFIQTLKRQIKALSIGGNSNVNGQQQLINNAKNNINNNNNKQSPSTSTSKSVNNKQSQQSSLSDEQQPNIQNNSNNNKKSISITEHTKTVQRLNKQIQAVNDLLKNKNKQLQLMKSNYNQLTKEYYRVVNQYGVAKGFSNNTQRPNKNLSSNNNSNNNNNNNNKQLNFIKPTPFNKIKQPPSQIPLNQRDNNNFIYDTNLSFNLSQDLTDLNQQDTNNNNNNDFSVSLTFEQNFKKFNNRPRIDLVQQQEPISHNQNRQLLSSTSKSKREDSNNNNYNNNNRHYQQLQQLKQLISSILQTLHLTTKQQILPLLNDITTKTTFIQINEQIINNLHDFLYKFGMGKVSKNQMIEVLNRFQNQCQKWIESNDLLDQICIEIGAKKHFIISKVNSYKQMERQYLTKMRTASFLTQLNKSQKILQFINFFELDQSNLQLPQQLKNIYQQLKYVDRFVKLANATLGIQIKDRKGLQSTLQLILKKLQKYYSWEVQIEKENQRKLNNRKRQKQRLKQTSQS